MPSWSDHSITHGSNFLFSELIDEIKAAVKDEGTMQDLKPHLVNIVESLKVNVMHKCQSMGALTNDRYIASHKSYKWTYERDIGVLERDCCIS